MKANKPETPSALAARVAADLMDGLTGGAGLDPDDIEGGIDEVMQAVGREAPHSGPSREDERAWYGRASFLVGVQIGLRLRNLTEH